jgi:hypothetical protein
MMIKGKEALTAKKHRLTASPWHLMERSFGLTKKRSPLSEGPVFIVF